MGSIVKFMVRYATWITFVIYAGLSCIMLFTTNPFQHHVYLTSAGAISSRVYGWSHGITSYFGLRDINEDLQRRNAELERENMQLKAGVTHYKEQLLAHELSVDSVYQRYDFVPAPVINSTINNSYNYATLQKGSLDGIEPEMGVIDRNGIVGIVNLVTPHTSRIITLLNPNMRVSCKVKGNQLVGTLSWDGQNPSEAILEELPKHAIFQPGDTVVTSGYSTAFPEGVMVGIVKSTDTGKNANFNTLRVKLAADFTTLSDVLVVRDYLKPEIIQVETDPVTKE